MDPILDVKSNGKNLYNVDNVHKIIFIKNFLDVSDDYALSAAKSQFWYLDTDATKVTGDDATNLVIRAWDILAKARKTV